MPPQRRRGAIVNQNALNQSSDDWTSLVSAADGGSVSLVTNRHKWAIDVSSTYSSTNAWMENYRSAFARNRPTLGQWEHVAGVWDGRELRLYINGELQGTHQGVRECSVLSRCPLFIGADPDDIGSDHFAEGFLSGIIRCVRISRGVEYTSSFVKPEKLEATPDTIGLYDFTSDTGRYAYDFSGHGNHGIIVGAQFSKDK